ncbi:BTAD domain-containing putative transcriptional regulator [Amycolatopsis sp. NPDC051372]|uniref:AfsR/SARP family transcriptional regulator n=1 Tax=Amycolatopsis sp. NPDC051372 TaxID=3155669 RepID=UPI003416748C
MLLLDAGQPVSLHDLVMRVWGNRAPNSARGILHSYFSRLRTALADEHQIVRRGHGYVLDAPPENVDVHRFRELVRRSRRAAAAEAALALFDDALGLWRGEPFAGLDSPWLREFRAALHAERAGVLLDRADLALELGRHAQVLPGLTVRVEQYPFDERLAGQLMVALHRTGRQAEALLHFQQVRKLLASELGVNPGPALRAVHQEILTGDAEMSEPRRQSAPGVISPQPHDLDDEDVLPPLIPRQLPAPPRSFTGREKELEVLSATPAPVSVIVGPGGVGKTALALHWAHEHVGEYPDAQLFVDLRGFDPSGERVCPDAAMRTFLIALGVKPAAIPRDGAAMSGLFRSLAADKRLLVIIDNARDVDQITPLLPGNPQCSVVVTSRTRLTGLVSRHGADLITLDVLDDSDAHDLLVTRLGPARASAEPAAVRRLVDACAGLPLALSIVVGRAQEHPDFSLTSLADELVDASSTLNALDVDADLGIRAVLLTSFAALDDEAADLLMLLGLTPGADIALDTAASLAGKTYAAIRTALRALERASLVRQYQPGRFRMHDLVRAYAREQAERNLGLDRREAGLRRLVSFYLHTLVRTVQLADPGRPPISPIPLPVGCTPVPLRDRCEALRWVTAEADNIAAVRVTAKMLGWHEAVWQLAWGSSSLYATQGNPGESLSIWQDALAAAHAVGDENLECLPHRCIAQSLTRTGNHEQALDHICRALAIAERSSDVVQQVLSLQVLSEIHMRQQHTREALDTISSAWRLVTGQSAALRATIANHFAWCMKLEHRYPEAREMAERSLTLAEEAEAHKLRPTILDTLGTILAETGNLEQAVDRLEEAVALFGDELFSVSDTLYTLGCTYRTLGRDDLAEKNFGQALELFQQQQRGREARLAQAALAGLSGQAESP